MHMNPIAGFEKDCRQNDILLILLRRQKNLLMDMRWELQSKIGNQYRYRRRPSQRCVHIASIKTKVKETKGHERLCLRLYH